MFLRIPVACLAILMFMTPPSASAQGLVTVRGSTQVAGDIGDAERSGDCDPKSLPLPGWQPTSSYQTQIGSSCGVQNFGSFTAHATVSGNATSNAISAAASMSAAAPRSADGVAHKSAASADVWVRGSDTLTVTSRWVFPRKDIFQWRCKRFCVPWEFFRDGYCHRYLFRVDKC
jgi:hypothetical protein